MKLRADKLKHFSAGLALSLLAGLLFCPIVGLATAAVVGALKEIIWDKVLSRETPEILDFVATVAGGGITPACAGKTDCNTST